MTNKTKKDHLKELVLIAFKIDDKYNKLKERSANVSWLAELSQQGLQNSDEYRNLTTKVKLNVSFQDELNELHKVVNRLKKIQMEDVNDNKYYICENIVFRKEALLEYIDSTMENNIYGKFSNFKTYRHGAGSSTLADLLLIAGFEKNE